MSPSLFRDIYDESFDLICLLDIRGTVLEANRTALKSRNLEVADVRGCLLWLTPWWDISADAQARLKASIKDAADGRVVCFEIDLLGPEGSVCTYDVTVKRMTRKPRGGRFLLCAARDISERKRVERALGRAREDLELRVESRTAEFSKANDELNREIGSRQRTEDALGESEAKIHAILHTAADAIITMTERGIMTSFNPAAERMFGYAAVDVLGRNVKMLMPDPYFSEHDRYFDDYRRTGKAKIIGIGREVLGLRKDGDTFPLDLAVSELLLRDQRMYTGIARDISDRKRLEREILEISDQEQLRIGQDLHDGLGQHLTGIAFLAKVLGEDLAAEGSSRAESAKKIAQLVKDAISRTRELAHGLSPVGLEAQGLIPALQELARQTEEILGIRCTLIVCQAIEPDEASANVHLYRIAQESVNNAVKHGKSEGITIRLDLAGGKGILAVEDDGIGFHGDDSQSQGMGLHIMAYRAGMIGAALTIRPAATKGTVVTCTFRPAGDGKQERSHGNKKDKVSVRKISRRRGKDPGHSR